MFRALFEFYRGFFRFKGRSSRSDFWWVVFVHLALIIFARTILDEEFGARTMDNFVYLASLLLFIPSLALWVRRLHDQDKSGWFMLMMVVFPIGPAILLVMMMLPGTPDTNKYGEVPVLKRLEARRDKKLTSDKKDDARREREEKRQKAKRDKTSDLKPADLGDNRFLNEFLSAKIDLSGRYMSGASINKCDVKGMRAKNTNFSFANFSMSQFVNVDFTGANFTASDLRGSTYENVKFVKCDMRGADLRRSTFTGCDFSGANLRDAKVETTQKESLGFSDAQAGFVEWYEEGED